MSTDTKDHPLGAHSVEKQYWRANVRVIAACLFIWFTLSFGFGILMVNDLNLLRVGGIKAGFWFAQQGSIFGFVVLVFYYAWKMDRLDRAFGVDER